MYSRNRFLAVVALFIAYCSAAANPAPVTRVPADGASVVIHSWLVAGILPSPLLPSRNEDGSSRAGFHTDFLTSIGGEAAARPSEGTEFALSDGTTRRFERHDWEDDYINLADLYGGQAEVCTYLYCELESPVEQEVYLHAGTNDGGKIWVDGQLVITHPHDRTAMKSQHAVKVTLRAGITPVLVKVDQAGGGWGVYLEVYGKSEHERILAASGPEALRQAAEALASLTEGVDDPLQLTGGHRDVYAFALYSMERMERDIRPAEGDDRPWSLGLFDVPRYIQNIRDMAEAARAGNNPFEGRTGTFEAAYLSAVDGTAQPFTVAVPESFSPSRTYSLLVDLHGAGGTHETYSFWWRMYSALDSAYHDNTIAVAVNGRGRYSGYQGLGEGDVLEAIDWVTAHYPIDPDRIYIVGGSMGGGGSWRIASRYPDRFAAAWPECGWPDWNVLLNTTNLPVYLNHGNADPVVTIAFTRMGAGLLRDAGAPVVYTEWDGVDHSVGPAARAGGWMSKLSSHTRVTDPPRVLIHADHPRNSEMYWAGIDRWIDPHEVAVLDARVVAGNVVNVSLSNVARAHMTPPARHLDESGEIVWMVNGNRLASEISEDGCYDIIRVDGSSMVTGSDSCYTVRPHVEPERQTRRPYEPGAVMNLYRGESFVIVCGTQSEDDALKEAVRTLAEDASHWLSPNFSRMEFGRVPVVNDTEVTDELLAAKNVFLIGGPDENSVTARLMADLPVKEEDGSLNVFDEERIPLEGRGYGLVYPNPAFPQRLMFVYSSKVPQFYTVRAGRALSWWVVDMDPLAPDIAVDEVARVDSGDDPGQNRLVRSLYFTHDWQLRDVPGGEITRHPANSGEELEFYARALIAATEADYAFDGMNPADAESPVSYVPGVAQWADCLTLLGRLITFDVSGDELIRFARHEGTNFPWIYPAVDTTAVNPEGSYRIVGPPWICWQFASAYQWDPGDVRFFNDKAVLERCLRREWGVR